MKHRLDIEDIIENDIARRGFNGCNLHDVDFYKNGKRIDIPEKIIDDFDCTGLQITDFITSDFYKTGWVNYEKEKD